MADATNTPRGLLDRVPLFGGLDASVLDSLAENLEKTPLGPGETLFRQGDAGDAMYLVAEGEVLVQVGAPGAAATVVDRLAPGAVVGEMALLTSPTRSATVVAAADGARLWRLDRASFEHLVARFPDVLAKVHAVARPRLERAQLAPILREWFGATLEPEVAARQAELRWRSVDQGQALFRHGDAGEAAYLVVSGRFEMRAPQARDGVDAPEFVGRGGILGASSLLDGEPQRRSAIAVRDSHVVEVPRSVADGSPVFLRTLARTMVERSASRARRPEAAVSIALVPASDDAPVDEVAAALAQRMARWGSTARLSSAVVDRRFGRAGVSQSGPDDPFALPLATWLDQQERDHAFVLHEVDRTTNAWTLRCLRQVDAVVVVANAEADAAVGALEADVAGRVPQLPIDLVLVHPDQRTRPSGTVRWLEPRTLRTHHHVRLGRTADMDRLARRLAGRGIGLALSGGGARGYTHIGFLRAIQERALPIDMVVGTSMGAVVGAGFALTQDAAACHALARDFGDRKKVLDYTLPLVALTRSRKVSHLLQEMYGPDTRIEDMWVPFACVSASLTHSEPRVHHRGPLWRAVRASSAIPGVFTPVLADDGEEVLVDGGVMNNFPVDVLREMLGAGIVIASNAYGGREAGRPMAFGDDISGWRVVADKLLPFRRGKSKAPTILGTLMRATSLSSKYLMSAMDRYADLVVRYPTGGTSSLQFDDFAELIAIGYEHGAAALDAWPDLEAHVAPKPAGTASDGPAVPAASPGAAV